MKIKYLSKRRQVYWYRRDLNEQQAITLGQPVGKYQVSLQTPDRAVAVSKADEINRRIEQGASQSHSELYAAAVRRLAELGTSAGYPEHVSDILSGAPQEAQEEIFKALPVIDQIEFRAAQEALGGRERPAEYSLTLSMVLEAWAASKARNLTPKSIGKVRNAVRVFLGGAGDVPLVSIDRKHVIAAVEGWRDSSKWKTRQDRLMSLSQLYEFAVSRELLTITTSTRNPFKDIDHGKSDKQRTELISDEVLRAVLAQMSPKDHLPALIARATGMRLSEVFKSTLVEVEGITCLRVAPSKDYRGAKTAAGNRDVPVRDSILALVRESQGDLEDFDAYSKRFGRAKRKVLGVDDRRSLNFHSTRVSFITKALRAGFSEMQVAWCVGHEESKGESMTGSLYHKGFSVATLKEIVESVPAFEV